MAGRIGRGGRRGQTHTATPRLRSYDVSPASEVTVTQADGTTEVVPAQKSQRTPRPSRKRGPLICAMCGHPVTESPTLYSNDRWARGKPVHGACDPKATPDRPKRPSKPSPPRSQDLAPPAERGRLAPGADPDTAWLALPCTQCPAQPGQRCVVRYSDGSSGEAPSPHRERSAAGRRAVLPR
ncbi:hypothetical protein [Streptomyces sp. NPDC001380]|uniref:hypothetical protein n=1 Tax=Streptomyces sp. NPDC001380 TaxID=3364566 RepID=UPI0036C5EA69